MQEIVHKVEGVGTIWARECGFAPLVDVAVGIAVREAAILELGVIMQV